MLGSKPLILQKDAEHRNSFFRSGLTFHLWPQSCLTTENMLPLGPDKGIGHGHTLLPSQ